MLGVGAGARENRGKPERNGGAAPAPPRARTRARGESGRHGPGERWRPDRDAPRAGEPLPRPGAAGEQSVG